MVASEVLCFRQKIMSTYTIDTAKAIDRLTEAGMNGSQARAIVEIFSESQESLATKADLRELGSRFTIKLYSVGALVVGILMLLEYLGI